MVRALLASVRSGWRPGPYAPPGVLDDPPVVDIFEGVTGHLLLVGAAPAVLVAAWRVNRDRVCSGLAAGAGPSASPQGSANYPAWCLGEIR